MVTTFGNKIEGRVQYIPTEILTDSVPGSNYELRIKTNGVPDPTSTINLLTTQLPNKFPGLKVIWIKIENNQITMQITGSPFAWAALLLFLPALLALAGIVTALIAVYLVFASIPGYVIGLFLVGVALIIFGPSIGEAMTSGVPTVRG